MPSCQTTTVILRRSRIGLTALLALAALPAATPAFGMATVFAIKPDNRLLRFKSNTPAVIDATVNITGLQVGETLIGIDFRPATGGLYGVGTTGRLYVIDSATGAAAQIGVGVFSTPLLGTSFGLDFNPIVDRLRIVSDGDQNIRINPANATVAGVDSGLAYAVGDFHAGMDPAVVAIAYQETVFGGSPATTLFGIDSFTNSLVRVGGVNGDPSPNGGKLTTIGPLSVDTGDFVAFDIHPTGLAVASLDVAGVATLYTINLANGAASFVGPIGDGTAISGLALAPNGRFQFSSDTFVVNENAAVATITVNRVGGSFGSASVQYVVNDGTATDPVDYTAVVDTLTFGAGETSKTFQVTIIDDPDEEPVETVNLTLLNPTGGATLGSPKAAVLKIQDNDGANAPKGCGGGICGLGMFPMAPLTVFGLGVWRRQTRRHRRIRPARL